MNHRDSLHASVALKNYQSFSQYLVENKNE
jgi:hypothetical protein